jgi:signal transduction histidine kinase
MELALLHNERLAAMGQLAAALAHEIRNPLQSIISSVQLILHYPVDEVKKAESLRIADRELQRLGRIVGQMLNFSRPPSAEYRPIQVADVIRYALSLTEKQLQRNGVNLNVSVADRLPEVLGSPDQLVQVLLNLILNAEEAMPGGGLLSVSARLVDQCIELTVTDDGPGFAPEAMSLIFQPFHTTKEEGTGLGLSVSHSIIQQHGGTISASNIPGSGAAVTIKLPLAPRQEPFAEVQE